MEKFNEARNTVSEVDKKIAELFVQRMKAVKEIALYKKEHGLPIYDKEREALLIEKNSSYIDDSDLRSYYVSFLKDTMEISKNYQHRLLEGMKIAYSGVEGAFAHIAAKNIFPDGIHISYSDFPSAYKAVETGECDCCVLPIENSYAGEVGQVTDLMFEGDLHVNCFYDLKISHNLLSLPGADIKDIKTVISHPQALNQCEGYISKHGYEQINAVNTAVAAKSVAEKGDRSLAAIASVETAKLYGLEVLDHDINESSGNTTRFAVFSRAENKASADIKSKFIMMFTVRNEAGALAKTVNVIAKHGFNMGVLRSRPVKKVSFHYYFYVEAEGDAYSDEGRCMLNELMQHCEKLKLVGSGIKDIIS